MMIWSPAWLPVIAAFRVAESVPLSAQVAVII
jgi:hypothetical protein